jgi:uncharacterized protein (TIGR00369 family)
MSDRAVPIPRARIVTILADIVGRGGQPAVGRDAEGVLRYDRGAMHAAGKTPVGDQGPTPTGPRSSPISERIGADPYGRWFGIELLELRAGYCRAALTLAPHMANFHGSPHGGAIFSLADFAFGGACNGHGEPAVALTVTIQFHTGARVGSTSWPRPGRRVRASAAGSTR